jgi:serine/threonine protein kinase
MSLAPGTRIGPYEIVSMLGAGGMGEVYCAADSNLKRLVALKVLPEALASDTERLARFQREAEVLASLNHPNVAAAHGLERTGTTTALVMELVEGPTLADRIGQGPLPVDEALTMAKQIADALEAAHEKSIIHRDLKPANIKVRTDGSVKVLDFGLAKALEPAGAVAPSTTQSPTITSPAGSRRGSVHSRTPISVGILCDPPLRDRNRTLAGAESTGQEGPRLAARPVCSRHPAFARQAGIPAGSVQQGESF